MISAPRPRAPRTPGWYRRCLAGSPMRRRRAVPLLAALVLTPFACGKSPAPPGGASGSAGAGGTTGGADAAGTGGAGDGGDSAACPGPAKGTWAAMSTTGAPAGAFQPGLFWTGTELFVYARASS